MFFRCFLVQFATSAYAANNSLSLAESSSILGGSNNSGRHCCSQLAARFGDKVSFPGSTTFTKQQTGTSDGYWAYAEQEIIPACRLTPQDFTDVSLAVVELAQLRCQFAVRGAGHMVWAGAANIVDGVTIDLSAMTTVAVSADHKVTSAGPGCRWKDIYNTLDPLNLAVVGGRVYDVGVAGLTIGGGNSWFASRYGFVCDNIVNFEVVLASGKVVDANITHNWDLYKALKGGGNNFGIVTRFDFKTFPQGPFWGGIVALPIKNTQTQLQALQHFTTASGNGADDYAALESIYAFNSSGQIAQASIIVETKPESYPAIFSKVKSTKPQIANDLRITRLSNLTVETSAGPNGINTVWATNTFANNANTFAKINAIAQEVFTNLPVKGKNYTFSNIFQPIPKSITRRSAAQGGNVLGLDPSEDVVLQFWSAEDLSIFNAATERYVTDVTRYTRSVSQYKPFLYMNYALPSQSVIDSYGSENVRFLKNVSKQYDPEQVFQRLVLGGFKLP